MASEAARTESVQRSAAAGPGGQATVTEGYSTYLDLLRILAAVGVVCYHLKTLQIGPTAWRSWMPGFGHEFVVVFFVLSGFVIASAVARKPTATLVDYGIDRISRIYSVALPALLLSVAASWVLSSVGDQGPTEGAGRVTDIVAGLVLNLLMLGQSWTLDIFPPSNPPFWSLCYEVFYYALFGCAVYLRGWHRWFGLVLIALLAGPKILLLMPCWLAGAALYRCRPVREMSRGHALIVALVLPTLAFGLMSYFKVGRALVDAVAAVSGPWPMDLARSSMFAKDYVTALLVVMHLYGVRQVVLRWPSVIATMIRQVAGLTFTLYLLHYPVLLLVKAGMAATSQSGLVLFTAIIAVVVSTALVGSLTELRLGAVRNTIRWAARRIGLVDVARSLPAHGFR